jgi:uncharacterized membrane protein
MKRGSGMLKTEQSKLKLCNCKMKRIRSFLLMAPAMAFVTFISCSKEDMTPAPDKYFPLVKTIIQNNCLSCHSSSGSWEGRPVSFDSDTSIAELSSSIKAAVADPISPTNRRMPQGGSLSATDIDIIVKWFNKGGKVTD